MHVNRSQACYVPGPSYPLVKDLGLEPTVATSRVSEL
jgi:hypothetical protein